MQKLKGKPSEASLIYFVVKSAIQDKYITQLEMVSWRRGLINDSILLARIRDRIIEDHQQGKFEGEQAKPKIPAWAIFKALEELQSLYNSVKE